MMTRVDQAIEHGHGQGEDPRVDVLCVSVSTRVTPGVRRGGFRRVLRQATASRGRCRRWRFHRLTWAPLARYAHVLGSRQGSRAGYAPCARDAAETRAAKRATAGAMRRRIDAPGAHWISRHCNSARREALAIVGVDPGVVPSTRQRHVREALIHQTLCPAWLVDAPTEDSLIPEVNGSSSSVG
jgi:hypothetical protein